MAPPAALWIARSGRSPRDDYRTPSAVQPSPVNLPAYSSGGPDAITAALGIDKRKIGIKD